MKAYWDSLTKEQQGELAGKVGSTPGYLRLVFNGYKKASFVLAKKLEQCTSGAITKSDLRPDTMLIGYVRVSTNDQNTDLQRNALNCAGCELIFEDKISGTKSERPGLKKLLRTLSAGDTLVVWKLDRLGRSMRHLVVLVEELRERGINFRSLTDSIDTSTPMGRFFFHVMGALAEMERELIVERTKAGLEAARAQGRIGGRRPKLTPEQWAQAGRLIASGVPRQKVAIIYDVGVSTLYKRFPAEDK